MGFTHRSLLLPTLLALAACAEGGVDPGPDAAGAALVGATPSALDPAIRFIPGHVLTRVAPTLAVTAGVPIELGGQRLIPRRLIAPATWLMDVAIDEHARATVDLRARTLETIDQLRGDPAVVYAHVDLELELSGTPTNDPLLGEQAWHHDAIRLHSAWDRTTGPATPGSVRLAIIDTGSTPHPDLSWGVGYDFTNHDSDPTAPFTYHHGVMVAGIAGATTNNGIGIAGVCWSCAVLPLHASILTTQGPQTSISAAAEALRWSAGETAGVGGPRRAEVANLSFNQPSAICGDWPVLGEAITYAVSRGVMVVVAAGNYGHVGGTAGPAFPGDCPGAFSVAALGRDGALAAYSNRGPGIDLVAPGGSFIDDVPERFFGTDVPPGSCPRINGDPYTGEGGIVSSWAIARAGAALGQGDHCYRQASGTSFAAPHVTGVVGLMLAVRPGMTPAQLGQVLRLTAQPPSPPWGWACPGYGVCGAGLLDADAAVDAIDSGSPGIATVTPTRHDFGAVPVGGVGNVNVVLGNIGFGPLSVTSAEPMEIFGSSAFSFAYSTGACTSGQICNRAFTVPVSGSSTIPVRCTPTSAGPQLATLIIPTTGVGNDLEVVLSCTGSGAPVISTSPTSLAFGNVAIGTTSTPQFVTVSNIGTAPLTVTGATTVVPFARVGNLPGPIAVGGSAQLPITCAPTSVGTFTADLSITSNGGNRTVQLSCTGVGVPAIAVSPTSLAFGAVPVGTTSAPLLVTVSNVGTAPLTVTGATTVVPFASGSLPGPVAVGGSAQIPVTCTPTTAGAFTANLQISSDGGNRTVALSCTGVAPLIAVSPPTIAFGAVLVGTTSPAQTVTIANVGTAPLTVSGITTTPPFASPGALPAPIAPGASVMRQVTCTPTATGVFTANFQITSNGGNRTVALACVGVAPAIAASRTYVNFGSLLTGNSRSEGVSLISTGSAPLTITGVTLAGSSQFSVVGGDAGDAAVGHLDAGDVHLRGHGAGLPQRGRHDREQRRVRTADDRDGVLGGERPHRGARASQRRAGDHAVRARAGHDPQQRGRTAARGGVVVRRRRRLGDVLGRRGRAARDARGGRDRDLDGLVLVMEPGGHQLGQARRQARRRPGRHAGQPRLQRRAVLRRGDRGRDRARARVADPGARLTAREAPRGRVSESRGCARPRPRGAARAPRSARRSGGRCPPGSAGGPTRRAAARRG